MLLCAPKKNRKSRAAPATRGDTTASGAREDARGVRKAEKVLARIRTGKSKPVAWAIAKKRMGL